MIKFAILGAGTWGTALGNMLINMGHQVSIWSPDTNEVDSLNKNRVHKHVKEFVLQKRQKSRFHLRDSRLRVLAGKEVLGVFPVALRIQVHQFSFVQQQKRLKVL